MERVGRRLDFNYFSAKQSIFTDYPPFRGKRSSITYSIKDSAVNIFLRMRMKSFHDRENTLKIF